MSINYPLGRAGDAPIAATAAPTALGSPRRPDPCPWCKSLLVGTQHRRCLTGLAAFAFCKKCDAIGPEVDIRDLEDARDKAIEAWNKRS